jgi:hypothetical protein
VRDRVYCTGPRNSLPIRRNSMHSQVTTATRTGTRGCGFPARHRLAILYRLCTCACASVSIYIRTKGPASFDFSLLYEERERERGSFPSSSTTAVVSRWRAAISFALVLKKSRAVDARVTQPSSPLALSSLRYETLSIERYRCSRPDAPTRTRGDDPTIRRSRWWPCRGIR